MIEIASDLGYVVEEADLIRTDLMLADEVWMTGTAAEVTPVRAIDDVELGVGPVTLEVQKDYLDMVNGRNDRWSHWLDVVEMAPPATAYARATSVAPRAASRTIAITRSWSSWLSAEPAGRQSPRAKSRAETSPPKARCEAKTGCRCIGFQSGRASMSSASSASRIASRSAPNASGSTRMQVSQALPSPYAGLGHERDPGHAVEQLAVAVAEPAARRDALGERLELGAPEGGEEVAHPVVEADLGVLVVRRRLARLRRELARVLDPDRRSSETSIPPPLVVMILFPLNENAASAPCPPAGAPR